MNKYVKFPLVLGLVALVSGALLSGTYQLTKDKIEAGKAERQTGALNDLFSKIDSNEVLEVPADFVSKGVKSIVKVISNGQEYKCFTITFKDSVGGDEGTIIIALDKNAKVYGVKFVSAGDSYMSKYNNDEYLAKVVDNNKFDAISGATFTSNDLNAVLKIAVDCFKGESLEPIDELFDGKISSKEEVTLPTGTISQIKKIYKVTSENKNYYAFEVSFKDSFDMTRINAIYSLNEDGTFYKLKIVDGDGYSKNYDLSTDLSLVIGATYSGEDLSSMLTKVQTCYNSLAINAGEGN